MTETQASLLIYKLQMLGIYPPGINGEGYNILAPNLIATSLISPWQDWDNFRLKHPVFIKDAQFILCDKHSLSDALGRYMGHITYRGEKRRVIEVGHFTDGLLGLVDLALAAPTGNFSVVGG